MKLRSFIRNGLKKYLNESNGALKIFSGVSEEAIENNKPIGVSMLKKEALKHNNSESLLRSGGFSDKALGFAAFGFTEESVKTIMPNNLRIKWKNDLENVKFEIGLLKKKLNNMPLSKIMKSWAEKINLNEPIDVVYEKDKFYIEDGHHRYYAAKILNKPLKVKLEIKENPIVKLSNLSYDDFHRDFFNKLMTSVDVNLIDESSIDLGNEITMSQEELNEILKGYLEAALWTEEENLNVQFGQSNHSEDEDEETEIEKLIRIKSNLNQKPFNGFLTEDLDVDSKIQAYLDIKNFIKASGKHAIQEAVNENGLFKLGMDFWLTRNHHGSGFFDHNYDFEKNLTDASHLLKSVDLYVGDDNKLHFSN